MSYILDALKKSQAEQAAEGVSLRMQEQQKRSYVPWMVAGLGLLLLCNAAVLTWLWWPENETTSARDEPGQSTARTLTERAEVEKQVPPEPITRPQPQQQAVETQPPPPTQAQQPPAQPARSTPARPESTQPKPKKAAPPQTERIKLAALPATEQTLYNGFNYSSHIYTDEPDLCVIVIDGQRLKAGDSFKGLAVIAITETGVIFEENRRGQRRQVEVSVLEQWER